MKYIILPGYSSSLGQALVELGINKDEYSIAFNDDFSIGPISELEKEKGQRARDNWFKCKINDEEMIDYELNYKRAIEEINHIPNEIPIYVWVTENAHEQTGLLFTINLLKKKLTKFILSIQRSCIRNYLNRKLKNLSLEV
jgi:hypothetical protein